MSLTISKTKGWRTSSGKIVANKDLFCTLDEAIFALERRYIDVGFWWIDRQVHICCSIFKILFPLLMSFLTAVQWESRFTRKSCLFTGADVDVVDKCKALCLAYS